MDMAPPVIPELQPQTTEPPKPQHNLRNPLPLSASQEAQVRDLYYKKVRSSCSEEIKAFAACAKGRTFTVTWSCRAQQFAMNSCMIAHATKANEDAAREEWFAGVIERRAKKEEELEAVEKRRLEVIALTRKQEEKERLELERKKAEQEAAAKLKGKATDSKTGWFWGK